MSDISNVSSRSGQSATANPSTTGYSPLAQNVEDAASAPAGANQLNRSGALGRDATEKLTGALNKQVSAGSAFAHLPEALGALCGTSCDHPEQSSHFCSGRSACRGKSHIPRNVSYVSGLKNRGPGCAKKERRPRVCRTTSESGGAEPGPKTTLIPTGTGSTGSGLATAFQGRGC
jgi:hypothetical protein